MKGVVVGVVFDVVGVCESLVGTERAMFCGIFGPSRLQRQLPPYARLRFTFNEKKDLQGVRSGRNSVTSDMLPLRTEFNIPPVARFEWTVSYVFWGGARKGSCRVRRARFN